MLNLNVQVGKNPLGKHKPIYFKTYQQIKVPYSFTVGEDGEIVAWKRSGQETQSLLRNQQIKDPAYTPVYYMIPSLNGDQQKCVSLIVSPLRLINKYFLSNCRQQKTYKIITYHSDNRLRIWQIRDGTCINISSHNFFSQKLIGLCQNTLVEARFLFAFSQNSIFIVDCWTMKVIQKLQPRKQVYSQFLKGRLNQKKQLELYDNYHKSYRLDVSTLFKQTFIDVGRTINQLEKVQKQLEQVAQSLLAEKLVLFHKVWKTEDYKTPLKSVTQSQNIILKRQKTVQSIFDQKLLRDFPQISDLLPQTTQITSQNFFFIKGIHLWYFVGTSEGKIYGFPAIKQRGDKYIIVKDESNFNAQMRNSVRYLNLEDNLLIASWQDGSFKIYTTDNLPYVIEQHIYRENIQNRQGYSFDSVSLEKLQIYNKKLSTSIKYSLPIYLLSSFPNVSSTKVGSQEQAFQLQNNQIIIFDCLHRRISHFVGIQEKKKVYAVTYLSPCSQYVGISTEQGIQVFGPEGYERRIQYKDWEWKQWKVVERYKCRKDCNNFDEKDAKGTELISFANRHTINQIEYTSSICSLLQQTFSLIDSQEFTDQLYTKFYFLDKSQVEKSLHSHSSQGYMGVLKHKHNNYRRDKFENTSFFLNSSLNKQLDTYSSNMSDIPLQKSIDKNFVFYSCFMWDLFQIPFLTPLLKKLNKTFTLKRRYASQGIGKTFTVYFDFEQSIFGLSKYLLTEYAIAAVSFMQCYVLKQIQKADDLVAVVQYFTLYPKRSDLIYISGQILSKSIISSNQNIVKACINLLISTIIAGHVNIHPLYEYFILNLKNMQQKKQSISMASVLPSPASKNVSGNCVLPSSLNQQTNSFKQLTEIQCEWMLYLGLGVIYGKECVQKEQIKMLLNRISECIQLNNFIKYPDLVQVVLKLLNEGLNQRWKQHLNKSAVTKLYLDLFRIFFYYDGIGSISAQDKKFNFCFQKNSPQQIRSMKQSIIKSIIQLSKQFNTEFIQILATQSVNQKPHIAYPASVIQILRQYFKSQRPSSYLVFYIQLLLQCLSPTTPKLRKYVQKSVIQTLQLMCTYKSISFNQSSQRLSIKSNNHLYIYCLRTSTKWRTISLLNEDGNEQIQEVRDQDCILQMSTQGNYVALMTYRKLYLWRVSSGFWSGVLGAFSQRLTFDLPKTGKNINIVWDQCQSSITVVNQDPSLNRVFNV